MKPHVGITGGKTANIGTGVYEGLATFDSTTQISDVLLSPLMPWFGKN